MLHIRHGVFFTVAASVAVLSAGAREARAQDAVIRGTVISERGEPVQAANVFVEDLRIAVSTSGTGQYVLTVPGARVRGQQVVVRVRAIAFKPASKAVTLTAGEQTVDVTLAYDVNMLEAVIVTGVQEATEQVKVPFSVSRLDVAQLPVPATNPLTQLQGKVPGANIVSASGRPGAQPAVLLRGPTSINAQGRSQDPLYIVDGVIINGTLPDLNPNDIESVEVVKGAAGASLYGARAGNGVVNITTKSGRRGLEGVQFNIRSEGGVSDVEREFALAHFQALVTDETGRLFCQSVTGQPMCARTFNYAAEQARINNAPGDFALDPAGMPVDPGASTPVALLSTRFQVDPWPTTGYNAVAQLVQPKTFTQNTLDMTGRFGTGTRFYVSASNLKQEGAIRFLHGFERSSFRMNVDQPIGTDWNLAVRTFYSRSNQDGLNQEGGGNAFFTLTRVPAIVNILQRDTMARLYIRPNLQGGGSQNVNPLYQLENISREDVTNRFIGGLTAQYAPVNWFNVEANFSYDMRRITQAQISDKGFRTTNLNPGTNGGNIFRASSGNEALNGSVNATFRHDFSTDLRTRYSLRYLYEQRDSSRTTAQGSLLSVKGVTTLDNTTQSTRTTTSFGTRVRQIGLFAGGNLEYKGRYIADALVRRDGSSLFGEANRWATFGRASLAWRVAQEPWWFLPQVSEFKIHGSYGTAGGSPNFSAQYETFTVGAGGILTLANLGNKNLRPEVHRETEIGTDIELFSRYALNVTYAHAVIDNQILPVPVSPTTGFQRQWQNAGTLQNKTWELSLNLPLIQRREAGWSMRFIYDRTRSVITKLTVPPFFQGTTLQGTGSMFQIAQGEQFGSFYGRAFLKSCAQLPASFQSDCGGSNSSFQLNDEGWLVWVGANNNPSMGITDNLWGTTLAAGSAPWGVALSWGNPIILRGGGATGTGAQSVKLGNALPDFRFAVTQDARYKRFSAYILVDAAIGQKVWNQGFHWAHLDFLSADVDQVGKNVKAAKPIGYYWRAPQPDGAGIGGFYDILGPNNYSVEDASYAKLRELLVSYHIGAIGGAGDWQVSLVGRNLFTLTGYRGFDPEVGIAGGEAGSAAINAVDAFTFPNTRSFTIGLSSSF
jgi:TonB-linked SusC/RagA family outer membrane protein